MTLSRRGMMTLGAIGLGTAALQGCANQVPRTPTAAPADVDHMLADLDRVVARIQELEAGARRGTEEDALCVQLLSMLCVMGTYRDVPDSVWHEPRVEARLQEILPRIQATMIDARARVLRIGLERGEGIDRHLSADPDETLRILERIDEQASRMDVPVEQRLHMRTTLTQLSGRMRFEGSSAVASGLVAKYDRVLAARKQQLALEEQEEVRPIQPPAPTPRPRQLGEAGESCRTNDDCDPSLECALETCQVHGPRRSEVLMKTTGKVAIYGAIFLIPPLCGVGALILTTCLFMVIVAGALSASGD